MLPGLERVMGKKVAFSPSAPSSSIFASNTHIRQLDTGNLCPDQRPAGGRLRLQGASPCRRCMACSHNPGKCLLWQGILCLYHHESPWWPRRSFHHAKCSGHDFKYEPTGTSAESQFGAVRSISSYWGLLWCTFPGCFHGKDRLEVVFRIHVSKDLGLVAYCSTIRSLWNSRSGLGIATPLAIWFLSMRETPVDQHGKIDYVGSALGTSSLILFNFVWK